jgi:hypothetical protein
LQREKRRGVERVHAERSLVLFFPCRFPPALGDQVVHNTAALGVDAQSSGIVLQPSDPLIDFLFGQGFISAIADLLEDRARFGLHAAAMLGGPDAEPAMDLVGKVADAERRHGRRLDLDEVGVSSEGVAVNAGTVR